MWSYILIDDDKVHFRSASELVGIGCYQTGEKIREIEGDERVRVSAIGPAGEKLVRYACISNDINRQAGRTGVGAVMGSKKLKAVALRGTKPVKVCNLTELEKLSLALIKKAQGPLTEKYRFLGTPQNILVLNRLAALPTRNFQQSTFESAESVSGEYLREHYLKKVVACSACPIGCEHIYTVLNNDIGQAEAQIDYETLFALGPLCGIDNATAIIKAAELCDTLGIDTISTGGSIAWAMECYQKGLINESDTNGHQLIFGNHQAMLTMIEKISRREGLGDLLADGVRIASQKLGRGSEHWAMHSKGLEIPGYEPRSLKTMALGYAVGTRGACHNRSSAYEVDLSARVDRFKGEAGRGLLVAEQEDFSAVLDSLMICKFLRKCFDDFYTEAAQLYSLTTGLEMSAVELKKTGERITNPKKSFNIREGWTKNDDWLPPRVLKDILPTGVAKGCVLKEEELILMIEDYYKARGWTSTGLIPEEKLRELGLADIIQRAGVR